MVFNEPGVFPPELVTRQEGVFGHGLDVLGVRRIDVVSRVEKKS